MIDGNRLGNYRLFVCVSAEEVQTEAQCNVLQSTRSQCDERYGRLWLPVAELWTNHSITSAPGS